MRPFHQILRGMVWGALCIVVLVLPGCGSNGSIEEGEQTYVRGCYSCHGAAGLGDGPTARLMGITPANLQQAVRERSKAEILHTISRGRKAMPSFGRTMTDEQREAVYRYLLTLQWKRTSASRGLDPTGIRGLR
jgi:mono/diheme cytochrome c family protein